MSWVILVVIAVIGYYALNSWAANDELKRLQWREDKINELKANIVNYHSETIDRYSGGETLIGLTKKETKEKIVEWQTEIEKIRLWDKHVKTVETSDTYSKDSKYQLQTAWFEYLLTYNSMVRGMEVGVGDPWEDIKNVHEQMDTFLAKLEAFGYDGEKEEKSIQKKLAKKIDRKV